MRKEETTFGTIARLQVKPGKEKELMDLNSDEIGQPTGHVQTGVYRLFN